MNDFAAVGMKDLAAHVRSVLAREEHVARRELRRLARATHRNVGPERSHLGGVAAVCFRAPDFFRALVFSPAVVFLRAVFFLPAPRDRTPHTIFCGLTRLTAFLSAMKSMKRPALGFLMRQ